MTKKLFKDEKAMRALKRALILTEKCHDTYECKKCKFYIPDGCGAIRVREAVDYVLDGNKIYDEDGKRIV